jgi:uncharacterized oxidoreductase
MSPRLDLSTANVLISGGSEGIGRGIAARCIGAGSRVLVTGRNADKLAKAARELPRLETFVNDISNPDAREMLGRHIRETMPGLNVVINNAGIQRRIALASDTAPWIERQAEIDTLLAGPVHLDHLLIPIILAHKRPSMIVNVTSGGAYLPQPFAPVYSACKAALHSYTVNLRYALSATACRVVEVIPPAVQTSLAGTGSTHGAPLDDFCDAVFNGLTSSDAVEIGYGITASASFNEPRNLYAKMFEESSKRFPVALYQ